MGTNDCFGVVGGAEFDADFVVWDAAGGFGRESLLLAWGLGDFDKFCFGRGLGHIDL